MLVKLGNIVKKFEEDRAILKIMVQKFNEMEDKEITKEKFKVQLDELKKLRKNCEIEVEFTFYLNKIEELNFNGRRL